jgi:hypothetical protein
VGRHIRPKGKRVLYDAGKRQRKALPDAAAFGDLPELSILNPRLLAELW